MRLVRLALKVARRTPAATEGAHTDVELMYMQSWSSSSGVLRGRALIKQGHFFGRSPIRLQRKPFPPFCSNLSCKLSRKMGNVTVSNGSPSLSKVVNTSGPIILAN